MRQLRINKQITNRETASLDKYLHEISKIPLLTSEEEVQLAIKIKQGDKDALEKFTKANLRFVVSVAKQYQNQGLPLSDLINDGNLGLIEAVQRFDVTRGFKFISYGVWWIRQSILRSLAEQARIVRLPLSKIGSINKINKVFAQFEQDFGREPVNEEIASILNIPVEDIMDTMRSVGKHVSMDAPLLKDENSSLIEELTAEEFGCSPINNLINESLQKEINLALNSLTKREAEVIRLYFGLTKTSTTLEEIAEGFDLTRERIRQIRDNAIRKLKHSRRKQILKTYLN